MWSYNFNPTGVYMVKTKSVCHYVVSFSWHIVIFNGNDFDYFNFIRNVN